MRRAPSIKAIYGKLVVQTVIASFACPSAHAFVTIVSRQVITASPLCTVAANPFLTTQRVLAALTQLLLVAQFTLGPKAQTGRQACHCVPTPLLSVCS